MSPKDHANLLGIFFWILGGIQALFLTLIAVYFGFFGFIIFDAMRSAPKNAPEATTIISVVTVVIVLYLLLALFLCVSNIVAGYGLRRDRPWAKFWTTAASIMSIFSFMIGGIILLPIGIALGVYSLWFIFGDYGRYYFANQMNPQMLSPSQMPTQMYSPQQPGRYQNWQ